MRMKVLVVACVIVSMRGAAPAGDDRPMEKLIFAGPNQVRGAGSYGQVQKPYDPWKIDWANYLYKDFYPVRADEQLPARPEKEPPQTTRRYAHGAGGIGIQAVEVLWVRFFQYPEEMKSAWPARIRGRTPYSEARDWRGYDVVRMDARFTEDVHLWWAIEDKLLQPPVVGKFDLKANTAAILEIDLAQAAKQRGLNLAEVMNMWALVDVSPNQRGEVRNVRLARRGAKADHPVLTDPDAGRLPPAPRPKARPTPDLQRDAAPLDRPVALLYKASVPVSLRGLGNIQYALVAAYDAKRILLVLNEGSRSYVDRDGKPDNEARWETFAVQTLDGGKTWTGLDGDERASYLYLNVGGQAAVIDADGGAIVHSENGCGNNPGPRHRVTKFSFLGRRGWTFNRKAHVFDEESRHCSHYGAGQVGFIDYARLASGRIWAALKVEGRSVPDYIGIHAKYSDDDGATWQTWKEGQVARIPGSAGGGNGAQVVPYGDNVAVLWPTYGREEGYRAHWSRFDGSQWSKPEVFFSGLHSAVSAGGGTILFTAHQWRPGDKGSLPGGILAMTGGKVSSEVAVRRGTGGRLALSGTSVFAIDAEGDKIVLRRRGPEGKWTGPHQLPAAGQIKDIFVPRCNPPNLVAVLYTVKDDGKSAHVLLIPSGDLAAGE